MRQHDGPIQSLPVRIPASTRNMAIRLAQQQGVSLNFFITRAMKERISRLNVRGVAEIEPRSGVLDN